MINLKGRHMLPLLPFAAGIIAGGLAVRWLRDENTRTGLQKARATLHTATQNSLATIKSSTAAVKQRFTAPPAEAATQDAATQDAAMPDIAKPAAKAKAAPRKRKAPAATASAVEPESQPAPQKRSRKPAAKAQETQE